MFYVSGVRAAGFSHLNFYCMSSITVCCAQDVVLPWGVSVPLSLALGRGECVGLVGRNGLGKTVLARVLAGELKPTAGQVSRSGGVGLLEQCFVCAPEASLVEALGVGARWAALQRVYAGEDRSDDLALIDDDWGLEARVQSTLDAVGLGGIALTQRADSLSGGEQTRLGIAGLLLREPDVLILDEPTNNLDAAGRVALLTWMRQASVGVLVISHDRELLAEVDRIVEISSLGLRSYGGNFEHYVEQKELEQHAARVEYEQAQEAEKRAQRMKQQRTEAFEQKQRSGKIGSLKRGLDKMSRYGALERSENTQGKLRVTAERQAEAAQERKREAFERLEQDVGDVRMVIGRSGVRSGERIVDLKHVDFGFGERALLRDVSLRVDGPERVALVGRNGSGKTSLLRIVLGELEPRAGTVDVAAQPVAYLDQHVAFLNAKATALESVQAVNPELSANACYAGLARFLFKNKDALRVVETLSGGERVRLGLACLLLAQTVPKLIILDEPTNHLDLASVQSMEAALKAYDGALLVVSHDATFLDAIGVTRRVSLDEVQEGHG